MPTNKPIDSIRSYLDSLGTTNKPVIDREAIKALKSQIKSETDSINKLRLLAELEREEAGHVPDLSGREAVFIAEAKTWADSQDIPASAFQGLGVPDDVLKQAGFDVTPSTRSSSTRRSSSTGTQRAPRIPLDDVAAAAKKLGSGWKLTDLAAALDREPTTVRNYVTKLIEQGTLVEVGDDPKHDGRGRAAKVYAQA